MFSPVTANSMRHGNNSIISQLWNNRGLDQLWFLHLYTVMEPSLMVLWQICNKMGEILSSHETRAGYTTQYHPTLHTLGSIYFGPTVFLFLSQAFNTSIFCFYAYEVNTSTLWELWKPETSVKNIPLPSDNFCQCFWRISFLFFFFFFFFRCFLISLYVIPWTSQVFQISGNTLTFAITMTWASISQSVGGPVDWVNSLYFSSFCLLRSITLNKATYSFLCVFTQRL